MLKLKTLQKLISDNHWNCFSDFLEHNNYTMEELCRWPVVAITNAYEAWEYHMCYDDDIDFGGHDLDYWTGDD